MRRCDRLRASLGEPPSRRSPRRLRARPARASAAAPLRQRPQARETQSRAAPRYRPFRRARIARRAHRRPQDRRRTFRRATLEADVRVNVAKRQAPLRVEDEAEFRRQSPQVLVLAEPRLQRGDARSEVERASGSRSSSGLETMLRRRSISGSASMSPASSSRACRSGSVRSLTPRRCRLARAERPIAPLPQAIAASARAAA